MHIHRKIEKFLTSNNYPPTKFGRAVARDPRLVSDMRRGRQLSATMIARAEAFMADFTQDKIVQEQAQ